MRPATGAGPDARSQSATRLLPRALRRSDQPMRHLCRPGSPTGEDPRPSRCHCGARHDAWLDCSRSSRSCVLTAQPCRLGPRSRGPSCTRPAHAHVAQIKRVATSITAVERDLALAPPVTRQISRTTRTTLRLRPALVSRSPTSPATPLAPSRPRRSCGASLEAMGASRTGSGPV